MFRVEKEVCQQMSYLDEVLVTKLLEALYEVETNDSKYPPLREDEDKYEVVLRSDDPLIEKIIGYANALLITKGDPNFDAIDELHQQHGYFVFPGERDRFGWLTACLQTDKGVIVFG